MSPNRLYQATVSELEGVLSPRVVSRSLKEGMSQIGSSPEAIELTELERILKAQIYRQLQVAMPLEQAKETISRILERLRSLDTGAQPRDPTPAPLDGQQTALAELQAAIRPFNLYFEWPEVQKLRAQIQLLEGEQSEGREAGNLLRDAREQLRSVAQKLEDSLVIQARDLGELTGLLEQVHSLGGPKVRRLENLLGQIREAQDQRQLATAEVERARKLGTDLRKLLESSVLAQQEQVPADETGILEVDQDEDEPLALVRDVEEGVNARLLMIDLESERFDLGAIESSHAQLLEHQPELRKEIDRLREAVDAGTPIGEELGPLRERLDRAAEEARVALSEDLAAIADDALRLRQHSDVGELSQAVQVARGVLEKSLPDLNDIRHVRDLHALASERAKAAEKLEAEAEEERQARLREQASVVARLESTVQVHGADASEEFEALKEGLSALRAAHAQGEHVPELLAAVRRSEERYLAAAGAEESGGADRPEARARAMLDELESLPLLPSLRDRYEALAGKLSALLVGGERANGLEDASSHVEEGELMLAALRVELRDAYRERLQTARRAALELGQEATAATLAQAESRLRKGEFPRLHDIEAGLREDADRRRQEELTEARVLESEAAHFAGLGLPGYEELCGLIEEAKGAPMGSRSAALLGRAWLQLEALRATVEQRLAGVESRLDTALAVLERVEKLNSEDVEESRRILRHLHDQRDSLGRVSLGLRLELESSLQWAESLLTKLQQEYEATRVIADQLVSGNFIDDMLGLLGSDQPRPETESSQVAIPDPTPPQTVETRSDNAKLNGWVEGYLAEQGVSSFALLDRAGKMVAGRLQGTPAESRSALDRLMTELEALGAELGRGGPRLATLEAGSRAMITSRPIGQFRLLAVLDTPSALSRVLHRLRGELTSGSKTSGDSPLA